MYSIVSRVDERGHVEVGGCDVVELAREFGTPAYVYDEQDLRARARATSTHSPETAQSTRPRRAR